MNSTDNQNVYLGVDGGASNITVAVVDQSAQTLIEKTSPFGANYHVLGADAVVSNLDAAVQDAAQELNLHPAVFSRAVFGLSGNNYKNDTHILTQQLRKSALSTMLGGGFRVVNDTHIALRAGTKEEVGLVLIAGTGSNCFGKNAEGQTAKSGGLDHLLSDEGSGYDIGVRSLQAAVQALDGRGEETALTKVIFNKLAVKDLESLHHKIYESFSGKADIASLAILTMEVASKGDFVARDILNHSVNELLSMIDAVLRQLNLRDEPVSIVTVGSIINNRNYMRQRLESELRRVAPKAKLIKPKVSPAIGAAYMAMEEKE